MTSARDGTVRDEGCMRHDMLAGDKNLSISIPGDAAEEPLSRTLLAPVLSVFG